MSRLVESRIPQERPSVSAIMVNWNGAKHLRLCLPSLLAQSHQLLEIIVVDNGSSDDSAEVAREFGVTWMPLSENIGLGPALNRGAATAKGDLLLFLNNDMRFDREFVAALAAPFVDDSGIFATDGMQYPWEGSDPVHTATRLAKSKIRGNAIELVPGLYFYQEPAAEVTETFIASAACMMARKDLFLSIGGFDGRLPLGYEDAEICVRARIHGWKSFFVPSAICWHRVSGSTGSRESVLLNFRGIIRGRLLLSTKLLPFRYALRTWLVSTAGLAKDVGRLQGHLAKARLETLLDIGREIPHLLREKKTLFQGAGTTAAAQLDSMLRLTGDAEPRCARA
jgi:hypothetical protein